MKSVKNRRIFSIVIALAIVITVVFTAIPLTASATNTTYYVDSTTGNDSNNGTSQSSAWQTLSKVNATTFGPGDTILFKRDCIWIGTLYPKGSGSVDGRITIDAYGTGNLPLINGNEEYYTATDPIDSAVYLNNQSYITIRNLEVVNDSRVLADRSGIHVDATSNACGNITIENNKVHNIASNGDDGNHAAIAAISILPRGYKAVTNVLIQNNEVYTTGSTGIYASSGVNGTTSSGMIVRNNYLHDIGGDGILAINSEAPLVEYNVVESSHVRSLQWCVAIWSFNCDNAVIQYNESFNTKTTIDGQGFDSDYQCHNSLFQYNYAHNNEGGFLLICCEPTNWDGGVSYNDGTVVRYNISQNNGRAEMSLVTKVTNTTIYNSTMYIAYGSMTDVVQQGTKEGIYPDNTKFYNNIIYNLGYGNYTIANCTNLEWDYNLFFGNHPSGEPTDAHKLTSDPQFVNVGSGGVGRSSVNGYRLNSASPALASGRIKANNGGLDFFGNAVSSSTAPNRGAYNGPGISGTTTTYPTRQYVTVDPMETATPYVQWGVGPTGTIALSTEQVNPNTASTKSMKVSYVPNSTGATQMHTSNATILNAVKSAYQGFYSEGMRLWAKFTAGTPAKYKVTITLFSSYSVPGVGTVFGCTRTAPEASGWVTMYWGTFGGSKKLSDISEADRSAFFAGLNAIEITFDATSGVTQTVYFDDMQMFGTNVAPPTTTSTTAIPPNSKTKYECEILAATTSSGDSQGNVVNQDASVGNVNALTANAVGDYVQYTIPGVTAATYTVKARIKLDNAKGSYQLTVNGTNVGSVIDCYNTGNMFGEVNLGNVVIASTGNQTFRFTVTAKNTASSGFSGMFDCIELTTPPQGTVTTTTTTSTTAATTSTTTTTTTAPGTLMWEDFEESMPSVGFLGTAASTPGTVISGGTRTASTRATAELSTEAFALGSKSLKINSAVNTYQVTDYRDQQVVITKSSGLFSTGATGVRFWAKTDGASLSLAGIYLNAGSTMYQMSGTKPTFTSTGTWYEIPYTSFGSLTAANAGTIDKITFTNNLNSATPNYYVDAIMSYGIT